MDNKGIKTLEAYKNAEKIRIEESVTKKEQQKTNIGIKQTQMNTFEQRDYSDKTEELKKICQNVLDDFLNDV